MASSMPPACLRASGAFQTRVSSSMTSAGQAAKMMAMFAALVWRAPMYCGPTAMPMPSPASRIRRGKCSMITWRSAHRRGPTAGSRIAKASAQRPKARNSGGKPALSAQRATSKLAANRAGVTSMSGSSAFAECDADSLNLRANVRLGPTLLLTRKLRIR